jgi:heme/copper-type cytochrome/quinol oxidase subunit 2
VDGLGPTIALGGFVITTSGALVAFLQNSDDRLLGLVWVYVASAVLPVVIMVAMLNAKQRGSESTAAPANYLNRPTRNVLRVLLVFCILGTVTIAVLGLNQALPGQKTPDPHQLSIPTVEEYSWQFDKSRGLKVAAVMSKENYPKGIPRNLRMHIRTQDPIAMQWKLLRIDGWIDPVGEPEKQAMNPGPFLYEAENRNSVFVELRSLEPDGEYSFELFYHTTGDITDDEWTKAKIAIEKEKAIVITVNEPG